VLHRTEVTQHTHSVTSPVLRLASVPVSRKSRDFREAGIKCSAFLYNICSKLFPLRLIFNALRSRCAHHSARVVRGMNCLRPLKPWGRGFESHCRKGYLYPFILCLCCPMYRKRPCDGLIPQLRSYRLRIGLRK
jgi:hypothetical protein